MIISPETSTDSGKGIFVVVGGTGEDVNVAVGGTREAVNVAVGGAGDAVILGAGDTVEYTAESAKQPVIKTISSINVMRYFMMLPR